MRRYDLTTFELAHFGEQVGSVRRPSTNPDHVQDRRLHSPAVPPPLLRGRGRSFSRMRQRTQRTYAGSEPRASVVPLPKFTCQKLPSVGLGAYLVEDQK